MTPFSIDLQIDFMSFLIPASMARIFAVPRGIIPSLVFISIPLITSFIVPSPPAATIMSKFLHSLLAILVASPGF